MNPFAVIISIGLSFLLGFGVVQTIRLEGLKKELVKTKDSLYNCLEENKKNEKKINFLTTENERVEKNLKKIVAINAYAKKETDNKIVKIISSHVPSDCESAMRWGAKESSKIAEEFINQ